MKPQFTLRFTGKDVKPEGFTLEDLQELLREIQAVTKGAIRGSVSLVSITRKSAAYGFVSSRQEDAEDFPEILTGVSLPKNEMSQRHIRFSEYLEKINHEKRSQAVFYDKNNKKITTFTRKKTPPEPDMLVREHVSVVGKVISAGGTGKPQAEIVMPAGEKVIVYGSELVIQQLGQRLYQGARVDGLALVKISTNEIKIEEVHRVSDFEPKGIATLFLELREQFGDKMGFDEPLDPVTFQRELRG